jgi:hypothetical protein
MKILGNALFKDILDIKTSQMPYFLLCEVISAFDTVPREMPVIERAHYSNDRELFHQVVLVALNVGLL